MSEVLTAAQAAEKLVKIVQEYKSLGVPTVTGYGTVFTPPKVVTAAQAADSVKSLIKAHGALPG